MSNNPAKYEVLIKQYLRSVLDTTVRIISRLNVAQSALFFLLQLLTFFCACSMFKNFLTTKKPNKVKGNFPPSFSLKFLSMFVRICFCHGLVFCSVDLKEISINNYNQYCFPQDWTQVILDNYFEISRWSSQESCGGTDCHFFAYSIILIASISPNPQSLLTEIKKPNFSVKNQQKAKRRVQFLWAGHKLYRYKNFQLSIGQKKVKKFGRYLTLQLAFDLNTQ